MIEKTTEGRNSALLGKPIRNPIR